MKPWPGQKRAASPLRQLLEVMDNLDRALAQPADMASLYQGVQMTRSQLEKVLADAGVTRCGSNPASPSIPTTGQ